MSKRKRPIPYRCDKCGNYWDRETGNRVRPMTQYRFRRCGECETHHGPDPARVSTTTVFTQYGWSVGDLCG